MSWQLIVYLTDGSKRELTFETKDEADAALGEVEAALGLHPRQQIKPVRIAGQLVVRPSDVRTAESRESHPPLA
jgi:hypothetical protein